MPPGLPVVLSDAYTVEVDDKERLFVLDNDSDPDGELDADTLLITVAPLQRDKYRVHDDHIHYDNPPAGATSDSFVYSICDNDGNCASAIVWITIVP